MIYIGKWFNAISMLFAVFLLFIIFVYFFFPISRFNTVIEEMLARQELQLSPAATKTFFPGIMWQQPILKSSQGVILHFDTVIVHPDWKSLLFGSVAVLSTATSGKGALELHYGIVGSNLMQLDIHDLNLEEIPFFKTVLGAKATGALWSKGVVTKGKVGVLGDIKLEVKNLSLQGVKLGSFPLPDVAGLTVQGKVKIVNGKAFLESFTLQGEGVYMRLSGELPSGDSVMTSPLNLSLEIMPKPDFLEKQKLVFMLLSKFAVSPGVYRIPVKGTLLKPEIL